MDFATERRLLQVAVGIGCLVPLLAGGTGMLWGAGIVRGVPNPPPADLDSHMRYLSGLLFGIGIGFLTCIPRIEEKGHRFRLLGAIVLAGGAGRALSLLGLGLPGLEHRLALGMELGTVPILMLWQWRLARRWRSERAARSNKSQGAAGPKSDDPSTWPAIGSDRPEDSGKTSLSSPERT
jgi:uncharacterized BrkB/YihY/UPF0761 family membrane protein